VDQKDNLIQLKNWGKLSLLLLYLVEGGGSQHPLLNKLPKPCPSTRWLIQKESWQNSILCSIIFILFVSRIWYYVHAMSQAEFIWVNRSSIDFQKNEFEQGGCGKWERGLLKNMFIEHSSKGRFNQLHKELSQYSNTIPPDGKIILFGETCFWVVIYCRFATVPGTFAERQ